MKRSWIGLGLLLILLAAALLVTWGMDRIHDPVEQNLLAAGESALAGDWDTAEHLAEEAEATWNRNRTFRACFADHGPVEEVDACFARLKVYLRMRKETDFAAACGETARKARAMGEANGLRLENLF